MLSPKCISWVRRQHPCYGEGRVLSRCIYAILLVLPQLPRERESRVTENAISARAAIYCFLQSALGRGEMIYIFLGKNCAAMRNRVKFEEINIMSIAKERWSRIMEARALEEEAQKQKVVRSFDEIESERLLGSHQTRWKWHTIMGNYFAMASASSGSSRWSYFRGVAQWFGLLLGASNCLMRKQKALQSTNLILHEQLLILHI